MTTTNPPSAPMKSSRPTAPSSPDERLGLGNSPDPELFPFLSRRLGGVRWGDGGTRGGLDTVGLEAVDAANAMLTLKHGPQAVAHMHGE